MARLGGNGALTLGNAATSDSNIVIASAVSGAGPVWVEVFASTEFDADAVTVTILPATAGYQTLDIGIGAAASEVRVVANLVVAANGIIGYTLPLAIPKGSRVCVAATTDDATSGTVSVQLMLHPRSWFLPRGSDALLTLNASRSIGRAETIISPGDALNTKGAWFELSASLPRDVRFALAVALHGTTTTAATGNHQLIDIAVGAVGFEMVVLENLYLFMPGGDSSTAPVTIFPRSPIPLALPAGVRVVARNQSSLAAGLNSASVSLILYCA